MECKFCEQLLKYNRFLSVTIEYGFQFSLSYKIAVIEIIPIVVICPNPFSFSTYIYYKNLR